MGLQPLAHRAAASSTWGCSRLQPRAAHESHGVNTAWIQPEGSSSDWPAVSTATRASARS
eukprot:scaffold7467_cov51-Phaeocystis_antarctica.AAC.1